MKNKIIFTLFILFYINSLHCQDKLSYAELTRKGVTMGVHKDSLRSIGQYEECIAINKDRLEKGALLDIEISYNLAACYAMTNQIDSAFYYLNEYIKNALDNSLVYVDVDFDTLRLHKDRWKEITDYIENDYLLRDSIIKNKELAAELFRMGILDQKYRGYGFTSVRGNTYNWGLQVAIDKQNLKRLKQIIKEYGGFPSISMVGETASGSAFFILQHSDISKKMYKKFKEAYQKKDVNSKFYAMLTDRYLMHRGKKQIYGTQSTGRNENSLILYPVEDFKNINSRRLEIGFKSTIEEHCKSHNIEIPKEYYNQ